jgi:gamma-glutamyl:cysteine ligase YbdK (ATP-grasp superfamily)
MDTPKSRAHAHPSKDPATRLARLEERLADELLDEEERCELANLVACLRRDLVTNGTFSNRTDYVRARPLVSE